MYDFLAKRFLNEIDKVIYDKLSDTDNWVLGVYDATLHYKAEISPKFNHVKSSHIEIYIYGGMRELNLYDNFYKFSFLTKFILWSKVKRVVKAVRERNENAHISELISKLKGNNP